MIWSFHVYKLQNKVFLWSRYCLHIFPWFRITTVVDFAVMVCCLKLVREGLFVSSANCEPPGKKPSCILSNHFYFSLKSGSSGWGLQIPVRQVLIHIRMYVLSYHFLEVLWKRVLGNLELILPFIKNFHFVI